MIFRDSPGPRTWPSSAARPTSATMPASGRSISTHGRSRPWKTQKGALKNRMAVVGDKVFAPASKSILVLENGAVVQTIAMDGTVTGVIKSDEEGFLWVSCSTSPRPDHQALRFRLHVGQTHADRRRGLVRLGSHSRHLGKGRRDLLLQQHLDDLPPRFRRKYHGDARRREVEHPELGDNLQHAGRTSRNRRILFQHDSGIRLEFPYQ